jgi:hypothetical protein
MGMILIGCWAISTESKDELNITSTFIITRNDTLWVHTILHILNIHFCKKMFKMSTFTFEGFGIAKLVYGLDGLGSIPGSPRLFSSSHRPHRLWGPPSLLSHGGKATGA